MQVNVKGKKCKRYHMENVLAVKVEKKKKKI